MYSNKSRFVWTYLNNISYAEVFLWYHALFEVYTLLVQVKENKAFTATFQAQSQELLLLLTPHTEKLSPKCTAL